MVVGWFQRGGGLNGPSKGTRAFPSANNRCLLLTGVLVAWLSGCASSGKGEGKRAEVRYQLGVEYFNAGRLEAAIDELGKAETPDSENAQVQNMLGLVFLRQGADHVAQAETIDCLQGEEADVVRTDANAMFRQASSRFRRAVGLKPNFPEAWNNLAVAYLSLRDWAGAIDAAQAALKDSTYTQPHVARGNLGWAYFKSGNKLKAWKALHDAVSRAPGFCVGRYRLAEVYRARGDFDQAGQEVMQVVRNPECPIQEAVQLAGMLAQRARGKETAQALFTQCVAMAPKSCAAKECARFRLFSP